MITAKTADSPATSTPAGSLNAAKALLLSASVLNINGTIQSGQSSNYSVNLDSGVRDTINSLRANTLANVSLSSVTAQAQQGKYFDLSPYLTTLGSGDVQVGARYNVLTNQIVLNSVVQGTGGYVYLNGKIISTSTDGIRQGNIIVNGGAGTVTINNTTGSRSSPTPSTPASAPPASSRSSTSSRTRRPGTSTMPAAPAGQQVATYSGRHQSRAVTVGALLQGSAGPAVSAITRPQTSICSGSKARR